MAGIPNGQQRMYLGGVFDHQRRPRASSPKVTVDVPDVNGMISTPGGKRKGLHHGANCAQSCRFLRYGGSVIGPDQVNLNEVSVSHFSIIGRNLEWNENLLETDDAAGEW